MTRCDNHACHDNPWQCSARSSDIRGHICTGVQNDLGVYQREKRKLVAEGAIEHIDTIIELRQWAAKNELPDTLDEVTAFKTYAIPMR